jgi:ABC-type uncharacterized transport system permease subunit
MLCSIERELFEFVWNGVKKMTAVVVRGELAELTVKISKVANN